MKILVSDQVKAWIISLSPETKHRVRLALRELAADQASGMKPLQGPFEGFYRLQVGGYRIIFSYQAGQAIHLDYADMRDVVYERFLEIVSRDRN